MICNSCPASLFIHIGIFSTYCFAIWYDFTYLEDIHPLWKTFAGRWKFLTWWNFCLHTAFYGLSIINDLFGTNFPSGEGSRSSLQEFRDLFFVSLVCPLGIFVQVVFWGLYFVDRELVFPTYLDDVVPSWHNHLYHTVLIPFLMLQMFLFYHRYPRRRSGLSVTTILAILYTVWVFVIAFKSDIWVYGILEVLNWPLRVTFMTVNIVLILGFYMIGEYVNDAIWSKTKQE